MSHVDSNEWKYSCLIVVEHQKINKIYIVAIEVTYAAFNCTRNSKIRPPNRKSAIERQDSPRCCVNERTLLHFQQMAFLSLPQVANELPQQFSLMLERHPNKHHLTVASHIFRVCTTKRIYLWLGSFRVPSAFKRSIKSRGCVQPLSSSQGF